MVTAMTSARPVPAAAPSTADDTMLVLSSFAALPLHPLLMLIPGLVAAADEGETQRCI